MGRANLRIIYERLSAFRRVGSRACSPSSRIFIAPTIRFPGWWWASGPSRPAPDGWTRVEVRAASLNHHDLWSLRGVGLRAEALPMILGCDAAGVDSDGNEVVVHSVDLRPGWRGDETLDPRRSILSERHAGTFAERVWVPRRNLVPKPPELSFAEAACLPTAWLTAYRMLFTRAAPAPGATVLVQGAGGGVATALIVLGARPRARGCGRPRARRPSGRGRWSSARTRSSSRARGCPSASTSVAETVGAATWDHSLKSLKPGGTLVISGATSGADPAAGLNRIFFLQLSVVGSTMGTRDELDRLVRLCVERDVRPVIESELPTGAARATRSRRCRGRRLREARPHPLRPSRPDDASNPRSLTPPDRREARSRCRARRDWSGRAVFIMSTTRTLRAAKLSASLSALVGVQPPAATASYPSARRTSITTSR